MPFIVQHTVDPFVTGLAAFLSGKREGELLRRQQDIANRQNFAQSLGQGITQFGTNLQRGLELRAQLQNRLDVQQLRNQGFLESRELEGQIRQQAARQRAVQQSTLEALNEQRRVQMLPPAAKSEYLTLQQRITGQLLDPEIPDDERQRILQEHFTRQQAILEANPPPTPPPMEMQVNDNLFLRPDLGIGFFREQDGSFQRFNLKGDQFTVDFDEFNQRVDTISQRLATQQSPLTLTMPDGQTRTIQNPSQLPDVSLQRHARVLAMQELQEFQQLQSQFLKSQSAPISPQGEELKRDAQTQRQLLRDQQAAREAIMQQMPEGMTPEQAQNDIQTRLVSSAGQIQEIAQFADSRGLDLSDPDTFRDMNMAGAVRAAQQFSEAVSVALPFIEDPQQRRQLLEVSRIAKQILENAPEDALNVQEDPAGFFIDPSIAPGIER